MSDTRSIAASTRDTRTAIRRRRAAPVCTPALPHSTGWRVLPCTPAGTGPPSRFRPGDPPATPKAPAAPGAAPTATYAAQPARRRWFGVGLTRPRRVLLALGAIWVISVFDLTFTLLERDNPAFTELNPLAAALLTGPTQLITAFKFGLLTLGSVIFIVLRKRRPTELACWFLLAAKVYVALRWYAYYDWLTRS